MQPMKLHVYSVIDKILCKAVALHNPLDVEAFMQYACVAPLRDLPNLRGTIDACVTSVPLMDAINAGQFRALSIWHRAGQLLFVPLKAVEAAAENGCLSAFQWLRKSLVPLERKPAGNPTARFGAL
ncbi:hypothetical protein H9P43_008616 [Blastocladiella emersonii ATCC 22665]|nr:hypothetical protein H9P43_008616 [Blastocladiella emersonii ATCC 22665]